MSKAENEVTYCFIAEWFDHQANVTRQYLLYYFLLDDTIEMYDLKNRRIFLKRCSYPQIVLEDLFIGAVVTIYARQLTVIDFGDVFTKRSLALARSRSIAVLKQKQWGRLGVILDALYKNNFVVGKMRSIQLTLMQAQEFYGDTKPTIRSKALSDGPVIAIEVIGVGADQLLLDLMGEDEEKNTETNFSNRSHEAEAKFLFENPEVQTSARLKNCAVCLIRPHIIFGGGGGEVVDAIQQAGFNVSAVQLFTMDRQAASEFMDVYKGILPQFNAIIDELCTGSCIVVEVEGQNVLNKLREFCGPPDPEIARHIAPYSLRAVFGQTKVKNAVHCTDLPEDGPLESSFFFHEIYNSDLVKASARGGKYM